MNTNGNHAIAEAEKQALSQQEEIPPPDVPPVAEKPKTLALFSREWFEANISGHEMLLRQKHAALCATQEYAAWQAEYGVVENLKAMRDLRLQHEQSNEEK